MEEVKKERQKNEKEASSRGLLVCDAMQRWIDTKVMEDRVSKALLDVGILHITILRRNREDRNLNIHCHENPKFRIRKYQVLVVAVRPSSRILGRYLENSPYIA
jgi:hypothetical protein